MGDRKPISTRTRFEVFKRDGFVCQYCGSHPPKVILHVDHITPVSGGGKNEMDNYVTACQTCNLGKSDKLLSDVPKSLSDKAGEVREREAQLLGFHEILESRRERLEDESWQIAVALNKDAEEGFRNDWRQSIIRFLEQLPFHDVLRSADIAYGKHSYSEVKTFKYFCAICWNKIKGVY